jgi:hypothetical protein
MVFPHWDSPRSDYGFGLSLLTDATRVSADNEEAREALQARADALYPFGVTLPVLSAEGEPLQPINLVHARAIGQIDVRRRMLDADEGADRPTRSSLPVDGRKDSEWLLSVYAHGAEVRAEGWAGEDLAREGAPSLPSDRTPPPRDRTLEQLRQTYWDGARSEAASQLLEAYVDQLRPNTVAELRTFLERRSRSLRLAAAMQEGVDRPELGGNSETVPGGSGRAASVARSGPAGRAR